MTLSMINAMDLRILDQHNQKHCRFDDIVFAYYDVPFYKDEDSYT